MTTTRTPINTDLPLSLADAKDHARILGTDDDTALELMIRAAALDIEDAAALALLPTTIVYTTGPCPGQSIGLPIGPVASGAVTTVEAIADDGTATTLTGWWMQPGRFGVVHLADAAETRVKITYTAQVAATATALPNDLKHAIADQVARYYDERGGISDKGPALSHHTARVIGRYRGVGL